MRLHRISLALAASLLVSTALQAQGQKAASAQGQSDTGGTSATSGNIFKSSLPKKPLEFKDSSGPGLDVWIAPLFVLLLLVVVLWFLNRKGFFGKFQNAASGKLRIKDQVMLGNRQFLVVAEYAGREIMLGIGPGFINHVCDLGDKGDEPGFETALAENLDTLEKEGTE